ncbi:vWA domain-containing protein [Salinarimonas soli]|nr:VWA domain-containing protein [Salinarimonas soli]
MLRLAPALLGGILASSTALAQGAPATVLVIDASNSMWGRVDGRPKIEIAREAVASFAGVLPRSGRLGVVAYGHRRPTDCADIETLQPLTAVDPARVKAIADGLVPRGKTPITAALRQAAGSLDAKGGAVVIVTDGVETCGGDPCALADEIKRRNGGIVAHVIGFDLRTARERASVACIAERTGGTFVAASGAADLAGALRAVAGAKAKAVVPARTIALEATDGPGGKPVPGASFTLQRRGEELPAASGVAGPVLLSPGLYRVSAATTTRTGAVEVEVKAGAPDRIQVPLAGTLPKADLAVLTPTVPAAGTARVRWSGPAAENDYVAVVRRDGEALETPSWADLREGNPLAVRAPGEAGAYEVTYVHGATGSVLARTPLTVTAVSATLRAPARAGMGDEIRVEFTGPKAAEDWIELVAPAAGNASPASVTWQSAEGDHVTLRMPGKPGRYEVRYVMGLSQRVLAAVPVEVAAASATVSGPARAVAGGTIEVAYKGPQGSSDTFVGIVPKGSGQEAFMAGAYESWSEEGRASLRVPGKPGSYELRYVLGTADGSRVLASAPLEVAPAAATVSAPDRVRRGGTLAVAFTGPKWERDFVTLVRAGRSDGDSGTYREAGEGSPATLDVPDEPGAYEVRYVMDAPEGQVVLARKAVRVD